MFIVLATAASKQPKRCDKRFCMNIFRYIHTSRLCTAAGSYLVSAMDVWCFSCACSSSVRIIFLSFCQSVQLSFTLTVLQRIRIPQVTSTTAPTTESKHHNKKIQNVNHTRKKASQICTIFSFSGFFAWEPRRKREPLSDVVTGCCCFGLRTAAIFTLNNCHTHSQVHNYEIGMYPTASLGLDCPPPRASHPK